MEAQIAKWERALRADAGLKERLHRLDAEGHPATRQGDLLCLSVRGEKPLVVNWNGSEIRVERRAPRKPFCLWGMKREEFHRLFVKDRPPVIVAMNKNQNAIRMGADHHNGSLIVSLLVLLQECGEEK